MRRRALLCAVGATALGGCGGRLTGDSTDPTDPTDANPETTTLTSETTTENAGSSLEVTNQRLVRPDEGLASELATVVGTVRNPTERTFAEVTAAATFEDADGGALDRTSATVSEFSPAQSWSFELVYPGAGEDARAVADYALVVEASD